MMKVQSDKRPAARFFRQTIGDNELFALSDGGVNYPAAMIFGNVPEEEKQRQSIPAKQVFIPYTILLIRTKEGLVLVDVGAGYFESQAKISFSGLDHTTTHTNLVVPSLEAAGFDPGDIHKVIITHAHKDHIGGLLNPEDELVFSNARYYVGRREWDYWRSADPSVVEAEALREHLALLISAARKAFNSIQDKVTFVEENEELLPGIRIQAMCGHTPGHLTVSISDGSQIIYNISDMVIHPLFIEHPEWTPALDMNAGQADETRRRFYAQAADENALVFAHHLGSFPNFGRIERNNETYLWKPTETAGR